MQGVYQRLRIRKLLYYWNKETNKPYYLDNDRIRAARAPLSSKGEPSSFKAYANGNWETDALPSNFDKNSDPSSARGSAKLPPS